MATNSLSVSLASGDVLDVREFSVEESLSRLFEIRLVAVSSSVDVDFEGAIGKEAGFEIHRTSLVDGGDTRYWKGICASIEQIAVEDAGLSTYTVRIVPRMWLLTQRRNYKVFQDKSELDIVLEILGGWGIQPRLQLDSGSYTKRRMRTQYAESDFEFVNRLLEDIGVTYYFEQQGGDTVLVLCDCPNKNAARVPVEFVDKPNERIEIEWVTAVRSGRNVRPGRYTQSDVDYRKALNYPLASSANLGNSVEASLERYHHNYGSFLWKANGGGDTPHADDRGPARTNEREGAKQVQKRIEAQRADARHCSFRTSAHDLRPGKVFSIVGHPRTEIGSQLLVASSSFSGNAFGEWLHSCECRYTDIDYRPPLRTQKPRTLGVESATVTGPSGEEIHTDEFGRIRVKFHWDREGANDETSSCWVPLSQPWAGAGFGNISLARVGQEVLVDFLGADPDRPVVIGRVFTTTTPPPYQLPKYKMVSGHRSESYPRPKGSAPAQGRMGGGPLDSPMPELAPAATPGPAALRAPTMAEGASSPVDSSSMPIPPSAPLGGGVPLVGLGADGTPGGATPGGVTSNPLPGPLGSPQASLQDLSMSVEQLKSQGPDLMDHYRSANGLMHNDAAGKETMYLQAQKDMFETVKANLVGSVGQNRVWTILGNDTTRVQHFQVTEVGDDRSIAVGGKQTTYVKGDCSTQSDADLAVTTPKGEQAYVAKNAITVRAAEKQIMLVVADSSMILMRPDGIVISAPNVFINPGQAMMTALANNQSMGDAAKAQEAADKAAADARKAAEEQASREQMQQFWETQAAYGGGW